MGDEIGGEAEVALGPVIVRLVLRRISAECENVGNPGFRVAGEDVIDFLAGVAYAGKVGDGRDTGGLLDADDEIVGKLACAASRAIGDRDKGRGEGVEIPDGVVEFLPRGGCLGWIELKGKGGLRVAKNFADVHVVCS